MLRGTRVKSSLNERSNSKHSGKSLEIFNLEVAYVKCQVCKRVPVFSSAVLS